MNADPASEAMRLLQQAYDAVSDDAARSDPRLAAIRHACLMGLEAAAGDTASGTAPLATFGEPGDRRQRWIIRFEDADVPDAVYDSRIHGEAGAELLARAAYREAEGTWNCHLMRIASSDAADEERQRARADRLEKEIAELRTRHAGIMEVAAVGREAVEATTKGTVPFLAARIVKSHEKHLGELRSDLKRHERSLETERRYHESNPEDRSALSAQELEDIATYETHQVRKSAMLARDLALAERVHETWRTDPSSLLLPIGTVVRTRAVEMLDDDWPIPVPGTVGVVVGYSDMRSRPNMVRFMGRVEMTAYEPWYGDVDRTVQYNYLPEELDILGKGTIVDTDETVDGPGWRPTHGHGRKDAILYTESMVVRSGGFLWRVQPCPDLPECTQVTTDDEDGRKRFSHLRLLEQAS